YATSLILASVTFNAPTVGFGYVPVRSPPAVPEGGRLAGAPVTFAHATSLIFAFVTASAAIVGPGYVPVRSPDATPLGGRLVGNAIATLEAVVTRPSAPIATCGTVDAEP